MVKLENTKRDCQCVAGILVTMCSRLRQFYVLLYCPYIIQIIDQVLESLICHLAHETDVELVVMSIYTHDFVSINHDDLHSRCLGEGSDTSQT